MAECRQHSPLPRPEAGYLRDTQGRRSTSRADRQVMVGLSFARDRHRVGDINTSQPRVRKDISVILGLLSYETPPRSSIRFGRRFDSICSFRRSGHSWLYTGSGRMSTSHSDRVVSASWPSSFDTCRSSRPSLPPLGRLVPLLGRLGRFWVVRRRPVSSLRVR